MMEALNKWISEKIMGDCWGEFLPTKPGYKPITKCTKCGLWRDEHPNKKPYATRIELAFKAGEKSFLWEPTDVDHIWRALVATRDEDGNREWLVHEYICTNILQMDVEKFPLHRNPATAICLAIYKLVTGKNWDEDSLPDKET